jgi:hypothetical protein
MAVPAMTIACHDQDSATACHPRNGGHRTVRLGAVMVHTVDSAPLDMPVSPRRLPAHIHCVERAKP